MRRRKFFSLLGRAVAALPIMANAQQADRARRIGVLIAGSPEDPDFRARHAAFVQGLQQLDWIDGSNIGISTRWGGGNADDVRKYAAELVALAPDIFLAESAVATLALQQLTRSVPIVFIGVIDPVGTGIVETLALPGGNATGFTLFEYGISAKWVELLKEIVPRMTRAAVLRDPSIQAGIGTLAAIQSVAPSLGVELIPAGVRDADEIERAFAAIARVPNSGMIVTPSPLATRHHNLITSAAARHRVPAVYPFRYFVASGGLICYGPDLFDPMRRAAGYVDRILKGEKPSDMPVQTPTKYGLVVNLQTAKTLGLEVPSKLLARADEVIE
jgi:putative ABC transport system substrate-binding protein